MKILLISVKSAQSKGGISTWTKHYLSMCRKYGLKCDLVNTKTLGKRAVYGTARLNIKDELARLFRINKDTQNLLKKSKKKYDVAHLNTSIGLLGVVRDYYLARKIKRKRIPVVTHFHCDIPFWVNNAVVRLYLKKLVNISNCNLVLCENSKAYLKNNFGAESIKVPNFIDNKMILTGPKEINDSVKNALFVGRVETAKGAAEIYQTATKLPHITFKLAGEVSKEIAAWAKPANVQLIGMVPPNEIIRLLDAADIFLFPSHSEGFSIALAESMARGVPAIATDVGDNREMLENKGGIIVPVGSVKDIENAISKMESAKVRKEMSCWSINKVSSSYTTDIVFNLILDLYKKVKES